MVAACSTEVLYIVGVTFWLIFGAAVWAVTKR